ncbi:MAG TPA: hypothetical protein VGH90_09305 [Chthoniobacteraceae bacterium]|jgi:hypothetical protein
MKFLFLLIFLTFLLGGPRALARWRQIAPAEREVLVRMILFTLMIAGGFLAALFIAPECPRALFVIPLALAGLVVTKFWKSALARIRRNAEERVDLERMKRVN